MKRNIKDELLGKLIFKKFIIQKIEYKGINSTVYSGKNIANDKRIALKFEERNTSQGDLEKEAFYLFQLKNIGIPNIISFGRYKKYNVLVEELLGKSLDKLFEENKNKPKIIRLKDMLLTGIQIIERIKFIHSNNIIHLDIKPANFLVGYLDDSIIYIIDFGFAKKYRSSRGKHVQFSKTKYFTGNLKFCSPRLLKGFEPSRRDDLESLGYLLIFLFTGHLPWENSQGKNNYELIQKIYNSKALIPIKELCKDLPKEMIEFFKYIKSLKFEEDPDYSYLTNILKTILYKININNDMNFSWIHENLRKNKSTTIIKMFRNKKASPFTKIFKDIGYKSTFNEKIDYSPKFNNGSKSMAKDDIYSNNKVNNIIKIKEEKKYSNNLCPLDKKTTNFENLIDKSFNKKSILKKQAMILNIKPKFLSKNISPYKSKNTTNRIPIPINKNFIKLKNRNNPPITRNNPNKIIKTPFIFNKTINIFPGSNNINFNENNNNFIEFENNNNSTTHFIRLKKIRNNQKKISFTQNNTKGYFNKINHKDSINNYNQKNEGNQINKQKFQQNILDFI